MIIEGKEGEDIEGTGWGEGLFGVMELELSRMCSEVCVFLKFNNTIDQWYIDLLNNI